MGDENKIRDAADAVKGSKGGKKVAIFRRIPVVWSRLG